MAKQLRPREAGTRGVRRLVRKEVGKALEALGGGGGPLSDTAVHDARKRLKKARALLRLLREALGDRAYQRENAALRDAARPLTEVRDAKVLVDALDQLAEYFAGQVDLKTLRKVRRPLRDHQREVRRRLLGEGDALGPVKESLAAARQRVKRWPVGRRGWSVLGAGIKKVYRQGRDARAAAQDDPSVENLHEWRKQAKYLWHQLQVLHPLWPAVLDELADQAHALADALGDDHDLAILRQQLQEERDRSPGGAAADTLVGLIDRRRAELQEQAWAVGQRLYEEKPKAFVQRLHGYWRAWRSSPRLAPA
jgi:CHAD domain-containing protein